ncbi:hypothetical protein CLOM_g23769 [Closterium sp. NIES-68]|nr:hypothetical protein CLOM_g23769 [Closterium sp. NIES-68]GJP70778.1 hypothetical protein CLOP_g1683 [Closterium sp. NIES-67]
MASALSSCAAALSSLRARMPALLGPVKLVPALEASRVAVPFRSASSAAAGGSPVKAAAIAHVRAASGVAAPVEAQAPAAASDVAPLMRPYLAALLRSYLARNPTSQKGVRLVQEADGGRPIVQDHLAFRTFGADGCGIESLAKVFLDFGYVRRDMLTFPAKKLRAYWFAPPEHSLAGDETDEGGVGLRQLPRVFISELEVDKMSALAQEVIRKHTSAFNPLPSQVAAVSSVLGALPWATPSSTDYQTLAAESEYAAWTLVNAYSLNHTTVSVHSTQPHVFAQPAGSPGFAIDRLNDFLQSKGLTLNSDGSILKASPDGLLLQSSSVADTRPFHFSDGVTLSVPSSYLEFAERLVLPEHKHLKAADVQEQHRREGFEVGNADKIFESTSSHQLAGRQ